MIFFFVQGKKTKNTHRLKIEAGRWARANPNRIAVDERK